MSDIQLPPLPYPQMPGNDYTCADMRAYARAAIELDRASRPAGEAVAWLHEVIYGDGEPEQALSFSPTSFPLEGVLGLRLRGGISATPIYTAPPPVSEDVRELVLAARLAGEYVRDALRDEQIKFAGHESVSDAKVIEGDLQHLLDALAKFAGVV